LEGLSHQGDKDQSSHKISCLLTLNPYMTEPFCVSKRR
jgi:hypothetical protein